MNAITNNVKHEDAPATKRSVTSAEMQAALEHLARLMLARAKAGEVRFRLTIEANPQYGFDMMVTAAPGPWGEPEPIYGSPLETRGSISAIDLSAAVGAMDEKVSERLTFFAECDADRKRASATLQAAE